MATLNEDSVLDRTTVLSDFDSKWLLEKLKTKTTMTKPIKKDRRGSSVFNFIYSNRPRKKDLAVNGRETILSRPVSTTQIPDALVVFHYHLWARASRGLFAFLIIFSGSDPSFTGHFAAMPLSFEKIRLTLIIIEFSQCVHFRQTVLEKGSLA